MFPQILDLFKKSKMPFHFPQRFINGTIVSSFDPKIVTIFDRMIVILVKTFQSFITYTLCFLRLRSTVYKVIKILMVWAVTVIVNNV